jgi:predicted enzyme related to lactoylglutathione lyase
LELARAIIFVKDMNRMAAFYGGTLGLTQLRDRSTDGWAEFAAGATTLALHAIPAELAGTIAIAEPPRRREDTPIKLVFLVTDVTAERGRLVERGVVMLELLPWGACDGIDPEGNVFQICSR